MLTPDEELKLDNYLSLLKDVFGSDENQTQVWLAEKLKEVNEELGDVIAELKVYKCQHLDTTKTKDLQDNSIRVCDDCDSVIES